VVEAEPVEPVARTARRLEELRHLLEVVTGESFRLTRGSTGDRQVCPMPGWTLEGASDHEKLNAAAELIRRLAAAEAESESLCSEILERYEEATLIQRVARRFATAVGQASIAGLLIDEAVCTLGARSGELWLAEGMQTTLAATFPPKSAESWDLREQGPLSALREGHPWSREASIGCESVVAVPLPGPTAEPLGVLVLRGRSGGRSYRSAEIKLLGSLSCLASAFIRSDRAAFETKSKDEERFRDGLAVDVRRQLAPAGSLDVPGLEVAAHCRTSRADGCDAFDVLPSPDRTCVLWTAHASPGGIAAALSMAGLRAVLRTETHRGSDPESVLEYARDSMAADLARSGHRTTVFLGRIDESRTRIDYMNAGHAGPLLIKSDGSTASLHAGGPALGAPVGSAGELGSCDLHPRDVLVISSANPAGVRDAEGGRFRLDRVESVVRGVFTEPVGTIRDRLLAEVASHCGERGRDDLTVVVVRILPSPGA